MAAHDGALATSGSKHGRTMKAHKVHDSVMVRHGSPMSVHGRSGLNSWSFLE